LLVASILEFLGAIFAILAVVCSGALLLAYWENEKHLAVKERTAGRLFPLLVIFFPKSSDNKSQQRVDKQSRQFVIFGVMAGICFFTAYLLKTA
jgi:hypothetical protein